MNEERRPNPVRPDPPLYTPVIFDDDRPAPRERRRLAEDLDLGDRDDREPPRPPRRRGRDGGGRGGDDGRPPRRVRGDGESDTGLLRILGVIVVLSIVVIALVVPGSPVRLIGRTSSSFAGDEISAKALDKVPAVPTGFEALSKLYQINVPAGAKGPWTIEVALTKPTTDGTNLGFYSYDSGRWTRIAQVAPVKDGKAASGDVGSAPGSIAVLRRSGVARTLGLIIDAGQVADARAVAGANVIAVMTGAPASSGDVGSITVTAGAVANAAKAAGTAKVYLGVAGTDAQAATRALGNVSAHVEAIATQAKKENAAGVFLDYEAIPVAQRDAFSAFVKALRERLQRDQLGLVVGVPASSGANGGAYDWVALSGSSDGLWLRSTPDAATYYDQMEALLGALRGGGTDLTKVSLVVDRRLQERVDAKQNLISLRDALTAASTIDRSVDTSAAAGATVSLKAQNLTDASPSLRWDNTARTVTFSYTAADGRQHALWIENRFSTAFRLDLASRFNLGGVVVAAAQQDDALPDVWSAVTAFVQDGTVQLMRPFGPYLTPCWQTGGGSVEGAACWTADSVPAQRAWHAPAEAGVYDVKLVVSDGTTFVAQQIALRVGGATATPTATPASTSATATATPRPAATATPTATPTPVRTATAGPTLPPPPTGGTPAPTPVRTPTPVPTAAPTQVGTPAPAPTTAPTVSPGQPPGPAGQ